MADRSSSSQVNRSTITRILRIAITLAAFTYLFSRVDLGEVFRAIEKIPLKAWLPSATLMFASVMLGVIRWKHMLHAYGAKKLPPLRQLLRLYLIGMFYNAYVPGGVGGDLVRGVATASAFSGTRAQTVTASLTVAFIERVVGMIGLLVVSASAFLLWPIANLQHMEGFALIALVIACLTPLALALARRLGPRLPSALNNWLSHLPPIESRTDFAISVVLSVVIQFAVALAGHVLISALAPAVSVTSSLVLIPLIAATAFIPITVGGAGVREGAFAFLYARIGVSPSHSIAASLAFWFIQLALGAIGGILSVMSSNSSQNLQNSTDVR